MKQLKNHLDLTGLEKRYGETLAVRGINLSLPENTYCCLLGPSGCGKTSLLRMIAGHEDITSGKVFLDNQDISNEPPACLLYTSPSPRDRTRSRMPSSA